MPAGAGLLLCSDQTQRPAQPPSKGTGPRGPSPASPSREPSCHALLRAMLVAPAWLLAGLERAGSSSGRAPVPGRPATPYPEPGGGEPGRGLCDSASRGVGSRPVQPGAAHCPPQAHQKRRSHQTAPQDQAQAWAQLPTHLPEPAWVSCCLGGRSPSYSEFKPQAPWLPVPLLPALTVGQWSRTCCVRSCSGYGVQQRGVSHPAAHGTRGSHWRGHCQQLLPVFGSWQVTELSQDP